MTSFDAFSEKCLSQSALRDLTGRWAPLVMVAIADGATRFGEIERRIGGSNARTITQTLRTLEADGLVERTMDGARPAYSLTPSGADVAEAMRALLDALYAHLGTRAT